jgi:hypothetical protein
MLTMRSFRPEDGAAVAPSAIAVHFNNRQITVAPEPNE